MLPSMIICPDGIEGLLMNDHDCNSVLSPHSRKKLKKVQRITDGNTTSNAPAAEEAKIHLPRHRPSKPIIKSPMFMSSTSSIYMAVCRYNSLIDTLYGGSSAYMNGSKDCGEDTGGDNDTNFWHRRVVAGVNGSKLEYYFLILINIYFYRCPIFEQTFSAILSMTTNNKVADTDNQNDSPSTSMSPLNVIETAMHRSVRHLCSHECFLRAYHPIREFSYLWRDIKIGNKSSLKKDKILSGWRCCQYSGKSKNDWNSTSIESRQTNKKSNRSLSLVYISPDGMEFHTKSKSVNYMNTLFSAQTPNSILSAEPPPQPYSSTRMIEVLATINPLYSPLGLLEELFVHDPWKLLVSTICLNVTTRTQVDKVLHEFLQRWPDALSTANELHWEEISMIISPLGLGSKRAKGLIRFSQEYLALIEKNDPFSLMERQVKGLHNVGQYGWAAYELFILKKLPLGCVKVCDHALQLYVEYHLGRHAVECRESVIKDSYSETKSLNYPLGLRTSY